MTILARHSDMLDIGGGIGRRALVLVLDGDPIVIDGADQALATVYLMEI